MISPRIIAALACLVPQAALAHIVLAEPTAEPGSYYAGFFRVGHGCEGSPTVALRIEIPANIEAARPQPKPGWTIKIEYAAPGGKKVSAITWRGRLSAEEFDQFGVLMRLPKESGLLYFPVRQTCEKGEAHWRDIPLEGQAWHDLPHPAPVLRIAPAPDGGEMHHH